MATVGLKVLEDARMNNACGGLSRSARAMLVMLAVAASGSTPGEGLFCDRFESAPCPVAPWITSANEHSCRVGEACSFVFTATGTPAPMFAVDQLPPGLSLDPGSGELSGTPEPGSGGVHEINLTATNGIAPDADQTFVLTVIEASARLSVSDLTLPTRSTAILNISAEVPAGPDGFDIALANDLPGLVSVPSTVFMEPGASSTSVNVTSDVAIGEAIITASNPQLQGGAGRVTVAARSMSFEIDPLVGVGETNSGTLVLDLPAPPDGTVVNLASSDEDRVTVTPAQLAFPAGAQSAAFSVNGIAEGAAELSATAPGYATITTLIGGTNDIVSIGNIPPLVPGKSAGIPISLSEPAPPGGLVVFIESADLSIATVEAQAAIPEGSSLPATNPRITGVGIGATQIKARTQGFAPDTRSVSVEPLQLAFRPDPVRLFDGWRVDVTMTLSESAPAGGLEVELTVLDEQIVSAPALVTIPAGQTTTTFGIEGLTPGHSTLRAQAANTSDAIVEINVGPTPNLTLFDGTVGEDLQGSTIVALQETPPEPVDITLSVADPGIALISTGRTVVGSGSLVLSGIGSQASQTFYVQGLSQGSTTLTATAPGFNDRQTTLTVTDSGFYISSPSAISTTTFSSPSNINITSARLNADGSSSSGQEVRAGLTVEVAVASDTPAVGAITLSPVVFEAGGGATRSTQFTPLTAGSARIEMTQPSGFTAPTNRNQSIDAQVSDE